MTGMTRRSSSASRDRFGAGARGFAADIQDVRPLPGQFERVGNGGLRIQKLSTVRKRVRRDVDDAHDERWPREGEFKLARAENHLGEIRTQTLRLK